MAHVAPSGLTLAAMDSTGNMLARTLHALAQHQDVQERLRSELRELRASGPVDYDGLLALPYLDAVCKESLRLCVLRGSVRYLV